MGIDQSENRYSHALDNDPETYDYDEWFDSPIDLNYFEHRSENAVPGALKQIKQLRLKGLVGRYEFRLAHKLGFACVACQVKDGICNTANCAWRKEKKVVEEMRTVVDKLRTFQSYIR